MAYVGQGSNPEVLTANAAGQTASFQPVPAPSPMTWSDKSISFNAIANNGYFIQAAITATMSNSPSNGDTIQFFVTASQTLTIQAGTGQVFQITQNISTVAGTLQNDPNAGASIFLTYRATSQAWCATAFYGNWSVSV
jgi:hypothetical protein